MFEWLIGCIGDFIENRRRATLGFLFGLVPSVLMPVLMDNRLLNQIGVMAPLIVVRQPVQQPVHIFERRADAVQGRGQLVHSIYRMCG